MITRAIIIDDEEGARESLANIIEKFFPEVKVMAKADSAKRGMEVIQAHQPDLVFLDIEMPHGNAFDLLSSNEIEKNFDVIFVTAFDHYAIRAIRFSALDYLLKPVDPDELKRALQLHFDRRKEKSFFKDKLNTLLNNIKREETDCSKRIAIPDLEGLLFIPLNEIIRCESDGNYTRIFTSAGKKILSSKSLSEYDELLTPGNFFRVHRSHLINLDHIKKYFRGEGGYVVMTDDSNIEVSRRKKNEFIEKVGKKY